MPKLDRTQSRMLSDHFSDLRHSAEMIMVHGGDEIRGDLLELFMLWKYAISVNFDEFSKFIKEKPGSDPVTHFNSTPEYHKWRNEQGSLETANALLKEHMAELWKERAKWAKLAGFPNKTMED